MFENHKLKLRLDIAIFLALCLSSVLPAILFAGDQEYEAVRKRLSFNIRTGFYHTFGNDKEIDYLGIERGRDFLIGFELNYFAKSRFGFGFGFDFYGPSAYSGPGYSEFASRIVPITATLKFYPTGNRLMLPWSSESRRPSPWLGLGVGLYLFGYYNVTDDWCEYSESAIDHLKAGWHLSGGLIYPLHKNVDISFETRLAFVSTEFALPGFMFGIGIR